jgi:hypothetical protein
MDYLILIRGIWLASTIAGGEMLVHSRRICGSPARFLLNEKKG